MKKIIDDSRLIYKCCSLYYVDNRKQQDICKILGISRPSVSRMIKQGREMGMVKIDVMNPDDVPYGELERQLEKLFHLKETVVVKNSPLQDGTEHISSAIGSATLQYLSRILNDGDYIGVTMGMTLQNIVRASYKIEEPIQCTFVPIVGGVGESRIDIHSNYLASEFARLFGGKCLQFFSPVIFSDKHVLEGFKREQSVKKYFDGFRKVNVTLVGIGIPSGESSTLQQVGYVNKEIVDEFVAQGAVGDIALQYFNIAGKQDKFLSYNERIAGMPLEQIKKVPCRIGVVGGTQKARAALGAIRGGYINTLITDVDCAKTLIEFGQDMELAKWLK